jgi:hypothetical protein
VCYDATGAVRARRPREHQCPQLNRVYQRHDGCAEPGHPAITTDAYRLSSTLRAIQRCSSSIDCRSADSIIGSERSPGAAARRQTGSRGEGQRLSEPANTIGGIGRLICGCRPVWTGGSRRAIEVTAVVVHPPRRGSGRVWSTGSKIDQILAGWMSRTCGRRRRSATRDRRRDGHVVRAAQPDALNYQPAAGPGTRTASDSDGRGA